MDGCRWHCYRNQKDTPGNVVNWKSMHQNVSYKNILLLLFSIIFSLVLLDVILLFFFPYRFATIGHMYSDNAKIYGWGYNPYESIRIRDPDTGENYRGRLNNHGWRDKNRAYDNPDKAFRILAIGDSVTFGAIVPAGKTYTNILESRLRKKGYNVEVINMGYGGWGTDQELKALQKEGQKYKPDLILFQFTSNDLKENGYFKSQDEVHRSSKPFFFDFDENGDLTEYKNNSYKNWTFQESVRYYLFKSQIISRLYALFMSRKYKENPAPSSKADLSEGKETRLYNISQNQITMIEQNLALTDDHPFLKVLQKYRNQSVTENSLQRLISSTDLDIHQKMILRILEKRWFHAYWSPDEFGYTIHQDPQSYEWRLYFALLEKAGRIAESLGARLLVFCQDDPGQFEWGLSWHRFRDDGQTRRNWMKPYRILEEYAQKNNIGFINQVRPYQRARNDPHPNIDGNIAIAEDMLDYLRKHHQFDLEPYQILKSGH